MIIASGWWPSRLSCWTISTNSFAWRPTIGVHREARPEPGREVVLGADHHRVAEGDDPRRVLGRRELLRFAGLSGWRSAPVGFGLPVARGARRRPGRGRGRGGGRARGWRPPPSKRPLQPIRATVASTPNEQRRPRDPQPALGQRRPLRLAVEGQLDEAVGEVGEDQDEDQLQRDQHALAAGRRRRPGGSGPGPASARGRSCSCAGRARGPGPGRAGAPSLAAGWASTASSSAVTIASQR